MPAYLFDDLQENGVMNTNEALTRVATMPGRARVAFGLAVAEQCIDAIQPDAEGCLLARQALDACWAWAGGERITGDSLAEYVEGPPDKDLSVRQLHWEKGPVLHGLVAITAAVLFAAHHGYESENNRSRAEPFWETSEQTLKEVLQHAELAGVAVGDDLDRVVRALEKLSEGETSGAVGRPVGREQLFQNLSDVTGRQIVSRDEVGRASREFRRSED